MSKKITSLVISLLAIVACVAIISGATFALFSETATVKNHLQTANFDAKLLRTELTYTQLDANGRLVKHVIDEDKDFTGTTSTGIFGEAIQDLKIVPGSYFEADLILTNDGEVAFDYVIALELKGVSNELAEQILITVTYADGTATTPNTVVERYLNTCVPDANGDAFIISDKNMTAADGQSEAFTVKIEFLDLDEEINNEAKGQSVEFDLTVKAVQEAVPDPIPDAPTNTPVTP